MIRCRTSPMDLTKTTQVGIGEIAIGGCRDGFLAAYALGSCVGVVMYCASTSIGGLAHIQLPSSKGGDPDLIKHEPNRFANIALNNLYTQLIRAGAARHTLRVIVVGGARVGKGEDPFAIGARNISAVRKWLWSNHLVCAAEDIGGDIPRTIQLDLHNGATRMTRGRLAFYL